MRLIFISSEYSSLETKKAIISYYSNDASALNTRNRWAKSLRELGLTCLLRSNRIPTGGVGHSIIIREDTEMNTEIAMPIRCLTVDLARIKNILNLNGGDIISSVSVYVYINLTRAQRRILDDMLIFNEAD